MVSKLLTAKIEDYDSKRRKKYEFDIDKILNSKRLLEEQSKVLQEWHKSLKLIGRVRSLGTIATYLCQIQLLGEFRKKPFNEYTKIKTETYNSNGICQKMIVIKTFFKWLYQTDGFPDVVRWLKPKLKPKILRYEELITWEETIDLMRFCYNSRDKCILALLRDVGGRLEETILRPKIRDLIKDEYGFKLRISGKTGERVVRMTKSVPYMVEWLNNHPLSDDPETALFCVIISQKFRIGKNKFDVKLGQPICYNTIQSLFKRLRERSNIKKPLHPHAFRHVSATDRALQGFQEKELRVIYGWSANSRMTDLYCNFDSRHVDEKILAKEGKIIKKEETNETIKPILCKNCGKENIPSNLFCSVCHSELNQNTMNVEMEKTFKLLLEIMQNPELLKMLEDFKKKV